MAGRDFTCSLGRRNLPTLPQDRIEEVADSYVDQLVAGEQIPSSRQDAERMTLVEKEIEQIDEADKREFFLTPQGDVLGASHVDESS